MQNDHPIQTLDSRLAWECRWYSVRQDRILLPDGSEGEYNILQMSDAVWVVPITANDEIVLIRSYRYVLREWCWELPAGHVEAGQTPLEAAQCELLQEAGGAATDWQHLSSVAAMNGISGHFGHFFAATGVTLGPTQHEATEVMTVHAIPRIEVIAMLQRGEIIDSMSVLGLMLAFCSDALKADSERQTR